MIRLGVVGYGCRIHRLISGVFRQLERDLKVVGIVDPDEVGVRRRLAASDGQDAIFYKDLDALVRQGKPDALAVGTRCNLHTPYAIKAARYDLPLYLEKPVAINMRQAAALERAFCKSRCGGHSKCLRLPGGKGVGGERPLWQSATGRSLKGAIQHAYN